MDTIVTWKDRIQSGDLRAVSRLITLIEAGDLLGNAILRSFAPPLGRIPVIGITGYPGAGKSTLVAQLTKAYRAEGKKVGVLAVDTSSPISGGAILGDRIRMQEHTMDDQVFIRSMATRGHRGGLSQAVRPVVSILEAARFDVVLIETVGVGQEEGEISEIASIVLVVVAPGLGDEVQAMKAGLFEVAHVVVVNKADRFGAEDTVQDLIGWVPAVVKAVARDGKGIAEILEAIAFHQEQSTGRVGKTRSQSGNVYHSRTSVQG